MKTLSVSAFQALVAEGEVDVVDVREPHEWATGHIPGARLVPLGQLQREPATAVPRDNVVFVCARGGRSAIAAKAADALGFARVYSLDGGTEAWVAAGLATVRPAAPGSAATSPVNDSGVRDEIRAKEEPDAPVLDALVGVNLRKYRDAQGWSLDELAREAGISRALLGQIELGQATTSIGVVWKLAQTLAVPFAALLSTDAAPTQPVVTQRAKAKRLLSADGRFSSRALFSLGEAGAPEFYELWLAPHSREDAEAHRPGTRENLIVTAGSLELHIGRDVRTLEAGDAVVFSADVPHAYVNNGRTECWMYLVMSYARR